MFTRTPDEPGRTAIKEKGTRKRKLSIGAVSAMVIVAGLAGSIQAQEKANTVIILGDDVGWFRISAYNSGMLGHQTTNFDRVAREGVRFTDWYSP